MVEDREAAIDLLLEMHRCRDSRAVLRLLLDRMGAGHGNALAFCYLRETRGGEYRLALAESVDQRWSPAALAAELHTPPAIPRAVMLPVISRLSAAREPVEVAHGVDAALSGLWAAEAVAAVQQAVPVAGVVTAPLTTEQGPAGLYVLCTSAGWPLDAAVRVSLHAATALGNLVAHQSVAQQAADLFMRSVISHVAVREIDRAQRYKRTMSVVVIEPDDAEESPARLLEAAALVARVMRLPDTAGRLDQRRVVVLLPETPAEGAAVFIRRLRNEAGAELSALRGAFATFPQDGATWEDLLHRAINRLDAVVEQDEEPELEPEVDGRQPMPSYVPDGPPSRPAFSPGAPNGAAAGNHSPGADANVQPGVGVSVRLLVGPMAEADVSQWQALVHRLSVVSSIDLERFEHDMAVFDVRVSSIARLLSQLGHLAGKMGGILNPSITGEIGLTLRPPSARPRRSLVGPGAR